jgi:hypothetical protein
MYIYIHIGQSGADYAAWILKPDSWGGAIECRILAALYASVITIIYIYTYIYMCVC